MKNNNINVWSLKTKYYIKDDNLLDSIIAKEFKGNSLKNQELISTCNLMVMKNGIGSISTLALYYQKDVIVLPIFDSFYRHTNYNTNNNHHKINHNHNIVNNKENSMNDSRNNYDNNSSGNNKTLLGYILHKTILKSNPLLKEAIIDNNNNNYSNNYNNITEEYINQGLTQLEINKREKCVQYALDSSNNYVSIDNNNNNKSQSYGENNFFYIAYTKYAMIHYTGQGAYDKNILIL